MLMQAPPIPLTRFMNVARTGEERLSGLVNGDGQHVGRFIERLLHAVAVVGIDVDDGDAESVVEQMIGGDDCVAE